ncbi:MAG: hypothetical protein ACRD1I_04870 [Terriglobia bacterium]
MTQLLQSFVTTDLNILDNYRIGYLSHIKKGPEVVKIGPRGEKTVIFASFVSNFSEWCARLWWGGLPPLLMAHQAASQGGSARVLWRRVLRLKLCGFSNSLISDGQLVVELTRSK